MKPYDNAKPNSRFLGFPVLQNRHAINTWSHLFEKWRPALAIEIGTWHGGFTCCLGIAGKNCLFPVHTIDTEFSAGAAATEWFRFLGIQFHKRDALAQDTIDYFAKLIQMTPGPALILCDGGDKQAELREYSALMRPKDVIAVHDYAGPDWPWGEIHDSDLYAAILKNNLTGFCPTLFSKTGWVLMCKSRKSR